MTSVSERVDQIIDAITPLKPQTWPVADLALHDAATFTLAERVHSPVDIPVRAVARINGYAALASEIEDADPETPLLVDVSGDVTPGDQVPPGHRAGQVWRVTTGAPIPEGADTVVPVADTDGHHRKVQIRRPASSGAHIWQIGADVRHGEVLVEEGEAIAPGVLGALVAARVEEIVVHAPVRVAVISTGSEVVDVLGHARTDVASGGEVDLGLEVGEVPDSNGPMIAGSVRLAGHDVVHVGVADDGDVSAAIRRVKGSADLIIVTGGVGAGLDDGVDDELPGKVKFVEVEVAPQVAPGFGVIGFGKVPVLALSGDPVAARISFELFARPALAARAGRAAYEPHTVTALSRAAWTSVEDAPEFVPVRLELDISGSYLATPSEGVGGLVVSDGLAVLEADTAQIDVGDELQVRLLRPLPDIRLRLGS